MKSGKIPVVGITLGDPAGIGPEVTAQSLSKPELARMAQYCIIGDMPLLRRHRFSQLKNCHITSCLDKNPIPFRPGIRTPQGAEASLRFLNKAVTLLKENRIDALVTAPVCKEAISSLGKKRFDGHTEFLAQAFGVKIFDMMFVAKAMRTVIVTRHIPLKRVSRTITQQKIFQSISLAELSLKRYFHIQRPHIAICGLNPHAGEGGKMGDEEIETIIPAVRRARRKGILVTGPLPADTLFVDKRNHPYDVIIAMYHDQGLIPIKTLYFSRVVNLTLGLPFIRTSPSHGTAYDIAGKNKADPSSMTEAIKLAVSLAGK